MPADASAFAVLGLEPDADPDAVDRAYRKLIKQYHPDRAGGDAGRAAEINRAYREIRAGRGAKDALLFNEDPFAAPGSGWRKGALFAAGAIAAVLLATGMMKGFPQAQPAGVLGVIDVSRHALESDQAVSMDDPLNDGEVRAAVREAIGIAGSGDEMALTQASRECHTRMRRQPGLAQLDRCAAFDDAVVQLQDRDPLRDQGPFSELAVTGRQMSSATLLSSDYLAIDSRLDRIRVKVELTMAPVSLPEPKAPDL